MIQIIYAYEKLVNRCLWIHTLIRDIWKLPILLHFNTREKSFSSDFATISFPMTSTDPETVATCKTSLASLINEGIFQFTKWPKYYLNSPTNYLQILCNIWLKGYPVNIIWWTWPTFPSEYKLNIHLQMCEHNLYLKHEPASSSLLYGHNIISSASFYLAGIGLHFYTIWKAASIDKLLYDGGPYEFLLEIVKRCSQWECTRYLLCAGTAFLMSIERYHYSPPHTITHVMDT